MIELKDEISFQLEQAKRFILEEDNFLVVSHVQPDGDAISSTIAIGLILQSLNKSFIMINEDKTPMKFEYLSGYENIIRELVLYKIGSKKTRTF
jgi:phosphoesterase RecJ-like protein